MTHFGACLNADCLCEFPPPIPSRLSASYSLALGVGRLLLAPSGISVRASSSPEMTRREAWPGVRCERRAQVCGEWDEASSRRGGLGPGNVWCVREVAVYGHVLAEVSLPGQPRPL